MISCPFPPKRGGQQHRKSGLRMGLTPSGGLWKMIFWRFFLGFGEIYEAQKVIRLLHVIAEGWTFDWELKIRFDMVWQSQQKEPSEVCSHLAKKALGRGEKRGNGFLAARGLWLWGGALKVHLRHIRGSTPLAFKHGTTKNEEDGFMGH